MRSLFEEVLAAEFQNPVLFRQIHQLTVDTYAVQHAGGQHPDRFRANADKRTKARDTLLATTFIVLLRAELDYHANWRDFLR